MDPPEETAPPKTGTVISDEARHNARMQMGNESVRGLFLINGGGAVALLVFLPQVWKTQSELALWVLAGLFFFTVGTALAAPINNIRAESSLHHQYGPPEKARNLRTLHLWLTRLSVACFAVGGLTVVFGGFITLSIQN